MSKKNTKKGVYITTSEPNTGKSIVSLGLVDLFLNNGYNVGYFRPVIDDFSEGKTDNHINTVLSYFDIDLPFDDAYAFRRSEIIRMKNEDRDEEIINKIIRKYKSVEDRFDFVVVEGTSFMGEGAMIEFDINIMIAKNLGIPAVIVASGAGKTMEEFVGNLLIAYDSFEDKNVPVLCVLANKVQLENRSWVVSELRKNLPDHIIVSAIPLNPVLANPSIREIVDELDGTILFGEEFINNQAGHCGVGAMQLRNYLLHLEENGLVITPGDRADIILGALQANISANYPTISGIILTGGLVPEDAIIRLIEGLTEVVPIVSVAGGTFEVTNRIGGIKSQIYAQNKEKIRISIQDFHENMEGGVFVKRFRGFESTIITSAMFQYRLLSKARKEVKHIVLPEGIDDRILKAAKQLTEDEAVVLTLLGDHDQVKEKAHALGIDLDSSKIKIINPRDSSNLKTYADKLFELRKHKGMTPAKAMEMMLDVSYFGTMMVYAEHADGMVSGAMHTTQHTIRPALQFVKTKPGISLISSVFFMCLEDRVSVYGDCAINPNPTAEQLAQIAESSASTSRLFGIEPRIAMLSYSSGTSGTGEDVEKVRKATILLQQKRPDLKVEGPIQYDAAVDMRVGKIKMPHSAVAGQANVFIFPDLNTGNNTYKAVQRETNTLAIGPVIQGLNKPVNDLSRGCTVEDVVNTVVATAIQAQES